MKMLTELNRRRWAVQLAFTAGVVLVLLAALLWGLQGVTPARADPGTLYVDGSTGSDDSDCTDAADPCATIGYALSQATNGDEILVAEGIYTETLDIATNVTLKGGYEAVGWTRDISGHLTIVDANGADDSVIEIDNANVTMVGFTIQGANRSTWAGGIAITDSTVAISGTVVRKNETANIGGGVAVGGGSHVSLVNSTIIDNVAGHGGGGVMIAGPDARAEIANVVVEHNEADYGGGIAVRSGASAFISNTHVVGNTANESGGGVGIWADGPVVVMADTVIRDNYGYDAGGMAMWEPGGTFTGTNLLVVDNHSGPGPAGIALWGSSGGQLMNVTVYGNDSATGVDGAEVEGPASGFPIINSILWGNGTHGGNLAGGNLNVSYCDIEGGWTGTGNIDTNPWFVDPANGDYHLLPWSPCIDSGTATGAPDHDFEGDPRPQNAGFDMGADEFTGTPMPSEGPRYVATSGSDDANLCLDSGAPCRTVGHAVETANARESVLVAQGAYAENLSISKPVTLTGGYEAVSWTRDLTQYESIIDGSGSQAVPGDWDGNAIVFPRVISDSGQYRMWYSGQNPTYPGWGWALGLAESPDGLSWTKHGDNPVLEPGAEGEWDSMYRGQVAVIKDGGLYQMWYSGSDGGPWQTGYATSTNGTDWSIYAGNPVLLVGGSGNWDEQEANSPTVIKDGDLYKMWYHGCDPDYAVCSVGYATSTNGVDWSKYAGNPVLTGTAGEWDEDTAMWPSVVKDGSVYKMWYVGGGGQIGLATSPDGVNWTKEAANPVLTEGWDGIGAYAHTVLLEEGTYRMWLRSGTDDSLGIGYAESPDGITWTMSISNPVLTPGTATSWGDPVVRLEGGSDGSALDGLTITGGDAFAGGGLLIANGGSALVSNCTITGNQSQGWGGGVWVTDADATIRDSTISHNSSGGSGGIEVNHDFGPTHLDLVSCRVEHNVGGELGGMQVWGDQASATVTDSVFYGNEGENGGGIALNNSSSMVISDSVLVSNTAYNAGAGIAVREGSSVSIHGTQIYANTAQGGEGGGISAEGSDVSLTGSWVVGNVAQNNEGGGIAVGDGSFHGENCVIAGNTSGTNGGGMWLIGGGPFHIVNCDVVGNDTANEGGALATTRGTQILITNTLIVGNGGNTGIADRDGSGSTITLGYCDSFGNSPDGTDGVTIIRNNCLGMPPEEGLDPLMSGGALPSGAGPAFATQWMSYDYRLEAASPAIDAGTPASAPALDIEGTPRDAAPDMGAYEWTGFRIFLPLTVRNFGP